MSLCSAFRQRLSTFAAADSAAVSEGVGRAVDDRNRSNRVRALSTNERRHVHRLGIGLVAKWGWRFKRREFLARSICLRKTLEGALRVDARDFALQKVPVVIFWVRRTVAEEAPVFRHARGPFFFSLFSSFFLRWCATIGSCCHR